MMLNDINETDINGFTTLMYAAEQGDGNTAKNLIAEGAVAGIENDYNGKTAISPC